MSPTPGTAAPAITAGGTTPLHNVSFADTLAQARHGAPANPAEQIAVQVQRAQVACQDQISIKLHPAELGRIEVKLENASDGTQIGSAHVRTPVTNAHLVCRLLLETKNT